MARPLWYAAFAPLLVIALGGADVPPGPAGRPVQVATVTMAPVINPLILSGFVQARVQADLGFRVGGKIVRRPVDIGQHVKAGQVLAELDPVDLGNTEQSAAAALRGAEANAAQAMADLQRYEQLSRIPLTTPHLVGARILGCKGGLGHGWSASCCRDGFGCGGIGGVGAIRPARRGGPGTCHSVVVERMDERPDRACVWGDRGQRAALADVVPGGRRRRFASHRARRRGTVQERGGTCAGGRGLVGTGDGSGKLDVTAIAG